MQSGRIYTYYVFVFMLSFLLPLGINANASTSHTAHITTYLSQSNTDFPVVDPNYIYNQLAYTTTNFQERQAGYVANAGHDQFAAYWSQEMLKNLHGFGPQVRQDQFPIHGWRDSAATLPAFNMEVSVPGLTHPEQEGILGCHYDGKADSEAVCKGRLDPLREWLDRICTVFSQRACQAISNHFAHSLSTQSANDDTSGCAYELGVGKALGDYWRSHHVYPARTVRFVIFDAEEQGLFGSFHYLNSTINGDLSNVVAMFNEEQSGINYPARFLGKLAEPFMPDYIDVTPLQDNAAYPGRIHLSATQHEHVIHFRNLWEQAIPAVFAQFQAVGYSSLYYYDSHNQNTSQSIFTDTQMGNIHIQDDPHRATVTRYPSFMLVCLLSP